MVCCNVYLQYCYLEPETIGVIPAGGYGSRHNQSAVALEWLAWWEHKYNSDMKNWPRVTVQTCRSAAGEKYIDMLPVDGYVASKLIVLQFMGW